MKFIFIKPPEPSLIKMLWKSHNLHRANLLNTENLSLESEISLKKCQKNVVSIGRRSLAMQFDGMT